MTLVVGLQPDHGTCLVGGSIGEVQRAAASDVGIHAVSVVLDLIVALHCGHVGQLSGQVDDIYRSHLVAGNHAILLGLGHDGHVVASGDGAFVGVPGLATVGAVLDGSLLGSAGDGHLLLGGVGTGNRAEGGLGHGVHRQIDHVVGLAHEEGLVGCYGPVVAEGNSAFLSVQAANHAVVLVVGVQVGALVDVIIAQAPHVLVVHSA